MEWLLNKLSWKLKPQERTFEYLINCLSQEDREEIFNTFPAKLHPRTVVGSGVCPKAVAKVLRCIFGDQGLWYPDHLDIPYVVYTAEPLEEIQKTSEQKLALGELCGFSGSGNYFPLIGNDHLTNTPRA
ncbi:hypothetical protein Fmac_022955 [Flemingia macrophylla]|uniref:Uncharacterized protein n=1 Tax=Flemingia macrophylla TaxID=520843 RepID=A0ABD1LK67_9FABA